MIYVHICDYQNRLPALSVCLSACLSLPALSVCLSVCLPLPALSIYLSLYLSPSRMRHLKATIKIDSLLSRPRQKRARVPFLHLPPSLSRVSLLDLSLTVSHSWILLRVRGREKIRRERKAGERGERERAI